MPPKKGNNKRQQTKTALSVDADIANNVVKELGEGENIDSKIITNGTGALEEELKENTKAKVTKRGSGRAKNLVPIDAEEQTSVGRKPAAKGKGKKKIEVEVIQNENEIKKEIKEEIEAETVDEKEVNDDIPTKPRGKGSSKKSKTDTKKARSLKEIEKSPNKEGDEPEPVSESTEPEKAEKLKKGTAGKRKKQDTNDKELNVEVKQEIEDEPVEKANKKSSRVSKKAAEISSDAEPQNKKAKSTLKEKEQEKQHSENFSIENNTNEIKTKNQKEIKPIKRGRNVTTASEMEDTAVAPNGDITEEILPKKRARKAANDNKEIPSEKPKKGRGKKTEKASDNVEEGPAVPLEKNDISRNGDIKEEKLDVIEESPKSSKRTAKKSEPVDSSAKTEPTTKARGGRKRAAPSANKKSKTAAEEIVENGEDNDVEDEANGDSKTSKTKKKKDSAPLNPTGTNYIKEDFELPLLPEGQTAEEPRYNLKISSWNVAGLRAWLKKEGLKFLEYEQPDIFCMQEIKCSTDQLPEEVERIPGYHPYWLCMPGGYAGVAIYSKIMPINVEYGIGNKEFDECGRIITAEYEKFFLINVYVPNSGRKLVNLDARMKWEKLFQEFVQKLDARKPVVICGDMNVSHQEIDLANPRTNTRNAGFTKEERDKMSELLSLGYIDTFRHLYPDRKGAYTFWTYMGNARARNVGWRLDYFIVSERFIKRVVDNCIRNQCLGSDHCPITLFMKL